MHDTLIAACDLYRYKNLGVEGYHDNCADNMRLALKAIGLRAIESFRMEARSTLPKPAKGEPDLNSRLSQEKIKARGIRPAL